MNNNTGKQAPSYSYNQPIQQLRPVYVTSENPPESRFEGNRTEAEEGANYYGSRINKSGDTVNSFLAAKAMTGLAAGAAFPIFEPYDGIGQGKESDIIFMEEGDKLPKSYYLPPNPNLIVDNNAWELTVPIVNRKFPQFNTQLAEAAQETDLLKRPLVFLVTTKLPHAIIYIVHEGQFYTVGYGFLRGDQLKNTIHDSFQRVGKDDLAHSFEKLRGAIYTADAVAPDETRDARIAWVGFLNMDMVNRMQQFLNSAVSIIYNGNKQSSNYYVSSDAYIKVSQMYLEAAGFIMFGRDTYFNCLIWAQKMLNININCGYLGNPGDCKPVSVTQFNKLKANLNSPNLPQVVSEIQQTVELKNICTRVGKAIGICGGGRRKRNNTRKTKTRKGKSQKRKTRKGKKTRRH
jgi:hypothetical protein